MAERVSPDLQAPTIRCGEAVAREYRTAPATLGAQGAGDLLIADEFGEKRERGLPGIKLVLENDTKRLPTAFGCGRRRCSTLLAVHAA